MHFLLEIGTLFERFQNPKKREIPRYLDIHSLFIPVLAMFHNVFEPSYIYGFWENVWIFFLIICTNMLKSWNFCRPSPPKRRKWSWPSKNNGLLPFWKTGLSSSSVPIKTSGICITVEIELLQIIFLICWCCNFKNRIDRIVRLARNEPEAVNDDDNLLLHSLFFLYSHMPDLGHSQVSRGCISCVTDSLRFQSNTGVPSADLLTLLSLSLPTA